MALILNPKAGKGSFEEVRSNLLHILSAHGCQVLTYITTPEPDSARTLALKASTSCDLILACGGDGTVHGVLQGIAESPALLGVLPLGTANALARNLLLPVHPIQALRKLLTYQPGWIPLGRAETAAGKRWFTVMAGAGPDGSLVHEMQFATKARIGRYAYYLEALRLSLTRRFPAFQVEYKKVGSSDWEKRSAVAMMASRIPDLGGLFAGLTRESRLHHPHLIMQLLTAPAHLAFPAWMASAKTGWETLNPWLTTFAVEELRCTPLHPNQPIYAQADGEGLGPLPLKLTVAPSALQLLMPDK